MIRGPSNRTPSNRCASGQRRASAIEITRKAFRRNSSANRSSGRRQDYDSDEAAAHELKQELAMKKLNSGGTSYVESTLYNWPFQKSSLLGHNNLASIQRSQVS